MAKYVVLSVKVSSEVCYIGCYNGLEVVRDVLLAG
jgi:hypothetical protein